MSVFHFPTARTARYVLRVGPYAEPSPVSDLWIALHGYGQLATSFADELAPISCPGRALLCPEALSRFYTNHGKAEIGASWMTSLDREYEILDQVSYLDALWEQVVEELETGSDLDGAGLPTTVLGFSQGCPAATRWLGNGQFTASRLILWGGDHAHDLTDEEWDALRLTGEIILVAGENDRIVPIERLQKAETELRDAGCNVRLVTHPGAHHLDASVLKNRVPDLGR